MTTKTITRADGTTYRTCPSGLGRVRPDGSPLSGHWVRLDDGTFAAEVKTKYPAEELVGGIVTVTSKAGKLEVVTVTGVARAWPGDCAQLLVER